MGDEMEVEKIKGKILLLLSFVFFCQLITACSPGGPDHWFSTSLEFNATTLPEGVEVIEMKDYGYYYLKNTGSEPLYIVEEYRFRKDLYEEDYPNSELPSDYVPLHKLVSGKAYWYNQYESGSIKQGWQQNSGGLNNLDAFQLKVTEDLLQIEGGSKNIAEDDRPEDVEIPGLQAFKIQAFYQGGAREITGTMHYRLNEDYDPEARAKGIEFCRQWNATQAPSLFLTLIIFIIAPIAATIFIVYLILQRKNKKQK